MASIEGLQNELVADLKTELKNDPDFDVDILEIKVKNAIRDVRSRRCYWATSYNESMIAADLENYYSVIRSVALYDYNQRGAEGQVSHDENSIGRTWVDRDKLFNGVVAFVKIF
jgi:hypothetical protein